jgi:pimeloyl-ACP methyl ester carboxylesterase
MTRHKFIASGAVERSLVQQTITFKSDEHQPLVMNRYRPQASGRKRPLPVMLLPGLGQNRYTWHLSRLSMVNFLVDRGMDVFVPEFRGHGLSRIAGSKAPRGFSDYVFKDVPAFLKAALDRTGRRSIFLCGHSLGGTIMYAIDPALEKHIRGYIFMGSPVLLGRGLALVTAAAKIVDGALISAPVLSKKNRDRIGQTRFRIDLIGSGMRTGLRILNSPINFLPYQLWYPKSIDDYDLRERIVLGFDQTSTAVVKLMVIWASRGKFVDEHGADLFERNLRAKRKPALFIIGDRDDVVPQESIRPAYDMIASRDKTWKEFNIRENGCHWGHIDIVNGKHAPHEVWPYVAEWMEERR